MAFLRKLTGAGPTPTEDGAFAPSPLALKRATSPMTDYDGGAYMPGHMPWKHGERLSALGVTIINEKADNSCHVDRHLVSGPSPKAPNVFGRLAAETLLKTSHQGPDPGGQNDCVNRL